MNTLNLNQQTTSTLAELKSCKPTMIKSNRNSAEVFGLKSQNAAKLFVDEYSVGISGYEPYVPKTAKHHFEADICNDLREFEVSGYKDGALFITGPKGIGKSRGIEQYYARLMKPVFRVTGHERMEVSDLLGNMTIRDGNTVFTYGPLTLAAMWGGVFLFDEADACPPEVLVGLHGILEMGDQFVIPENDSEVIPVKQGFRVIVTGNTAGSGDMNGDYAGTVIQNSATMDRFNFLEWDYPTPEAELEILNMSVNEGGKSRDLPIPLLQRLIDAANLTRQESAVEPLSVRALIRWARKIRVYGQSKPLSYSLDRAFTYKLSQPQREEVYAVFKAAFGEKEFFGEGN
jgi:cobaltochelatase CobS